VVTWNFLFISFVIVYYHQLALSYFEDSFQERSPLEVWRTFVNEPRIRIQILPPILAEITPKMAEMFPNWLDFAQIGAYSTKIDGGNSAARVQPILNEIRPKNLLFKGVVVNKIFFSKLHPLMKLTSLLITYLESRNIVHAYLPNMKFLLP
jgi:hypothetical protein